MELRVLISADKQIFYDDIKAAAGDLSCFLYLLHENKNLAQEDSQTRARGESEEPGESGKSGKSGESGDAWQQAVVNDERLENGWVKDVLWLTDSGRAADWLWKHKCAVVGWIPEEEEKAQCDPQGMRTGEMEAGENFQGIRTGEMEAQENLQAICTEELEMGNPRSVCTDDITGIPYVVQCPQELDSAYYIEVYQRCAGISRQIGETKRCIIRESRMEDLQDFLRIYQDCEIAEYVGPFCLTDNAEEYLQNYIEIIYPLLGYGVWTIVLKDGEQVIGRVGFEPPEDEARGNEIHGDEIQGNEIQKDGIQDSRIRKNGIYEDKIREKKIQENGIQENRVLRLGYLLDRDFRRMGLAWEVCQEVLRIATEDLAAKQVDVWVDRENTPSLRLAEKLGFQGWHPVYDKLRPERSMLAASLILRGT